MMADEELAEIEASHSRFIRDLMASDSPIHQDCSRIANHIPKLLAEVEWLRDALKAETVRKTIDELAVVFGGRARAVEDLRTALTLMRCDAKIPLFAAVPRDGCQCERCSFARRVLG